MKDLKKHFITTFVIGAVLLAGTVIAVNMIFNNINIGRFDLTANKIYKLSPSVAKILSKLEAPIDITYYVSSSEKMPTQWKNLERDVIDKLEELRLVSRDRLNYTVFDPSAEEEKEAYQEVKEKEKEENEKDFIKDEQKPKITRKKIAERLYERGVIPFGVQSTERDELSVKRIYSSIVLSYLDRKEDVIEEVRPETFGNLEYEIMSRIYKLISNKKPKIGFYPGQPELPPQYRQYYQQQPPPDQYSYAEKLLKESGYDVTRTNIKKDDPIPEDIQTMVVMIDQPMNERQFYELDKLIHSGIRIVMAAQQYNYQITPSRGEPGQFDLRGMPSRLNINTLAKNYGFEFDDKIFMDKSSAFIQIPVYQTRRMGMFQIREQRYEPVTKPVIIKINAENINSNLSISNKITELFYMYGNRMLVHEEIMKENNLNFETLFTSSNFSWTREGYGYGNIDVSPPSPEDVLKHQPLGILVGGKFKSKYVDQNIPKWPKEPGAADEDEEEEPELPSEIVGDPRENKMIVVGCSNIFKNDILQSVNSHKALLLNCVDALTLGDELINIRSKNIVARRIKTTSGMGKALSKMFVVWFPPLVFVALGIFVTIKRKKK
ncbi:MAG: GldG family protein [bacterium]|nr:MAG: GldG family protein [bacterium]